MMQHAQLFRIAFGHSGNRIKVDLRKNVTIESQGIVCSLRGEDKQNFAMKQLVSSLSPIDRRIMDAFSKDVTSVMKYLRENNSATRLDTFANTYVNIWVLNAQTAGQNFTECKAELSKGLPDLKNRDLLKNIRRTADSDWYNTDRSRSDWKWGSIRRSAPQKRKQLTPTRFAKSDVVSWTAKTQPSYMPSSDIVMVFITDAVEPKEGKLEHGWFWQAKIGFAKHLLVTCARVGFLTPKWLGTVPQASDGHLREMAAVNTWLRKAGSSFVEQSLTRRVCSDLDNRESQETNIAHIWGESRTRRLALTGLQPSPWSIGITAAEKDNGCRLMTTVTEAPHAIGSVEKASIQHRHVSRLSEGAEPSKLLRLSRPIEPALMRNEMQMHPKYSYGEHRKEHEPSQLGLQQSNSSRHGVGRRFNVFHSTTDFVSKNVGRATPTLNTTVTCGWGVKQVHSTDTERDHIAFVNTKGEPRRYLTHAMHGRCERVSPSRQRARHTVRLMNKFQRKACALGIRPQPRTEKGERNVRCN